MGGKSAPAPDYSGMEKVANRQLDFAESQYADMKPIYQGLAQQMMDAQTQQMGQAQDYYNYQRDTFRPVEQGLVRDAERFNTDDYRESKAREAAAAAGTAFQQTQGASNRAMASMGINPNSGRFASMTNQNNLALAAGRAGAMTGARNQAEQLGWARRMDVTGLGRNLAGASTAAYQGAGNAGTGAGNTLAAPGNQLQQGLANAGQTFGNMANIQANVYKADQEGGLDVGSIMQGASAMKTAGMFSDRRLKMNIKQVGRDERTMLPLYEFEYIDKPGTTYLGVMSDDVRKKFSDMVVVMPNGYDAVNYAGLGIEMIEVEPCA
jgi:hypothetical protein